jgi:hypothetical protein
VEEGGDGGFAVDRVALLDEQVGEPASLSERGLSRIQAVLLASVLRTVMAGP